MHADIKPANIMVVEETVDLETIAKMSDDKSIRQFANNKHNEEDDELKKGISYNIKN